MWAEYRICACLESFVKCESHVFWLEDGVRNFLWKSWNPTGSLKSDFKSLWIKDSVQEIKKDWISSRILKSFQIPLRVTFPTLIIQLEGAFFTLKTFSSDQLSNFLWELLSLAWKVSDFAGFSLFLNTNQPTDSDPIESTTFGVLQINQLLLNYLCIHLVNVKRKGETCHPLTRKFFGNKNEHANYNHEKYRWLSNFQGSNTEIFCKRPWNLETSLLE